MHYYFLPILKSNSSSDQTELIMQRRKQTLTQNGSPPSTLFVNVNNGAWIKINNADKNEANPVNFPKCEK